MKICPECQTQYADTTEFCERDGMKLRPVRTQADDPLIGVALDGRWIIDAKIGEGGMGAVYRGSQRSVNRQVAIKTLRPALTDNDEFVDRFFREAKIATTINHPHVVTVLDFGQTSDDILFLAMEFLDGAPLSGRLGGEPLSELQIVKIASQIASALAAAHEQNIVHRDLKPDNIFLLDMSANEVFIKVLDFGIAKVSDGSTQYTRTGQIFGTPDYMSPEQASGATLDGRSDLYAVGCILYELLTGAPPFQANTPMAILLAHLSTPVTPMAQRGVHVSPGLEAIVMRLLAKQPEDRFINAAALGQALRELQSDLEGQSALRRSQAMGATHTLAHAGTAEMPALTPPPQAPARLNTAPNLPTAQPLQRQPTLDTLDDSDDLASPSRRTPLIVGALVLVMMIGAGSAFALYKLLELDAEAQPSPSTQTPVAASVTPEPAVALPVTPDAEPVIAPATAPTQPEQPATTPDPPEPQPVASAPTQLKPEPVKRPSKTPEPKPTKPDPKPDPNPEPAKPEPAKPEPKPEPAKRPDPKPDKKPAVDTKSILDDLEL